jgi:MFS family permease
MKIFLLFVFWCLWFLNFSVRLVISPLLPLIEDEFALSHAFAGGIFFFIYSGSILAVFSSGYISIRIGYKRSIAATYLILIVTLFCLRYAQNYLSFAFLCFFLGVGVGMYLPCAIPLITAIFDPGKWGKAISFHETAAGLSFLAIPLLTVFALQYFHWTSLFLILSGSCLIVVMAFSLFSPDPRPVKEKKQACHSSCAVRSFGSLLLSGHLLLLTAQASITLSLYTSSRRKECPLNFQTTYSGFQGSGDFLL